MKMKKSDLPDDGLLAGGATSFGGGGDTLFVHVSLLNNRTQNGINYENPLRTNEGTEMI